MQNEQKHAVEVVDVVKKFGEVAAVDHVSLNIREGEFFSMLGPSGCGKTTTLRMIAGFEHPTSGEIYIEGTPVAGVPPFRRNVNTVFQSYALFPHMTVAENVAFGLEATHAGNKQQIAERAQSALDLVRLGNYGKRRPRQMSGGQQQRVALARALVNHPAVLLLDEPLGALDLKLRKEMQIELKNLQTQVGITFIYVTHDQEEALTMSDRIAVMSGGKVLQVGSPAEIYERPNCRFVADFIGQSNFLQGKVTEVAKELVTVTVGENGGGFAVRSPRVNGVQAGSDVTLAVRPEKINLIRSDAAHEFSTNGQNRAVGRIARAIYMGTTTQYVVNLPGAVNVTVERQNGGIAVPNDAPSYKQGRLVAPSDDGGRFVEHEEVVVEWSPAVTLLLEQ